VEGEIGCDKRPDLEQQTARSFFPFNDLTRVLIDHAVAVFERLRKMIRNLVA
jgi:hypothetical protein